MAKNKFLTSNYGFNNKAERYAFKISKVDQTGLSNTSIKSITIETNELTEEFINTIKLYKLDDTSSDSFVAYNCNIRTTNSVYSTSKVLVLGNYDETAITIHFYSEQQDKDTKIYSLVESPISHPSESMALTTLEDNVSSGKIHNVFFFDDYPLLGNVQIGYYSVSIGYENIGGQVSTFSNGQSNIPLGDFSSAFGWKNKTGYACSAFGFENTILGQESAGFGAKIKIANGAQRSAGFGANHTINVSYGMAFGYSHQITGGGTYGTAFGLANSVKGKCGLAAGNGCISNGENSFSFGEGLRTYGKNVAVFGQYNAYNTSGKKTYLFAIGNGTSGTERKNALELDLESNLKIEGDLITKDGKLSDIVKNASNKQDIELLEKYGTTDVYVLQEGVDFITDETGTKIIGSVDGEKLYYTGKIVTVPDNIVSIEPIGIEEGFLINCYKFICSKSIKYICSVDASAEIILNDIINDIVLTDDSASNSSNPNIKLTNNNTYIASMNYRGTIISPANIDKLNISSSEYSECSLYIYNPKATINCSLGTVDSEDVTIYGYAGSTAEKFANDNRFMFINIGSDCAPFLNNSTSTETTILANQYYTFTNISSLTVTLDTASTTKLDEFMFSFETPADISAFSFGVLTDESVEIKWIKEPNLKPDYVYEVSVVNGVGVIAGTAKGVAE